MTNDNSYSASSRQSLSARILQLPREIQISLGLQWLALILAALLFLSAPYGIDSDVEWLGAGFEAVGIVLAIYVNVMLFRAKNWARYLLLIIASLSTLILIVPGELGGINDSVEKMILMICMVLDVVSCYFLFSQPGANYFKRAA